MSVLLELFLTFGRISLIAIGGANAAIPETVTQPWMCING